MKINTTDVSDTAWSGVDKGALGQQLKDAGRNVINEAYAVVPADAFDGDTFLPSKAWGPHHEIKGGELVLNRQGLAAAAAALGGARSAPNLSPADQAKARAHLLKHYRALKLTPPASLSASEAMAGAILAEFTA